jgi:magnesium transporter
MNQVEITLDTFKWTDLTNPTKEMLEQVASEFGLAKKLLYNCLDPDYLPHVEIYGSTQFVILRFMEPAFHLTADTVQELTTKVALFINHNRIVSIHRLPLAEIDEVEKKLKNLRKEDASKNHVISLFFEQVSLSFDQPMTELEHKLENFEERMFQVHKTQSLLKEGYYIKRKASSFKKVMKFTIDAVAKVILKSDCPMGLLQETKDRLERNYFYAEEVFDNIQALLNLHMSIESQKTNEASFRTNEIMRVLTVLSIFFLPLNFLAGVFGMNFEHIPLLKDPYGFWVSVFAMFLICLALSYYVLKKGWLMDRPDLNQVKEKNKVELKNESN